MEHSEKYIICNYAKADWGKTETLLEVIDILIGMNYPIISQKPTTGKDKWCQFKLPNKDVVVSTLGDPYSDQAIWIEDAADTGAQVIVTASRTRGSTIESVYDVANRYGYEIIWFQNFHFDNKYYVGTQIIKDIRQKEAQCIVDIVKSL